MLVVTESSKTKVIRDCVFPMSYASATARL